MINLGRIRSQARARVEARSAVPRQEIATLNSQIGELETQIANMEQENLSIAEKLNASKFAKMLRRRHYASLGEKTRENKQRNN